MPVFSTILPDRFEYINTSKKSQIVTLFHCRNEGACSHCHTVTVTVSLRLRHSSVLGFITQSVSDVKTHTIEDDAAMQ
jgi:hypothetical protein